jgi:hypothetical protein
LRDEQVVCALITTAQRNGMNVLPNEITEVITGTAQGRLPITAWARPLSNVPNRTPHRTLI